jgi:hypothetical protein
MANITITGSNLETGELTLSDHGHTNAKKKETIVWNLGKDCGVASIVEIAMKPSPASTNIFSTPPHNLGSSTNWSAVVSDTVAISSEYIYFIKWMPITGGDIKTFDPKISIIP